MHTEFNNSAAHQNKLYRQTCKVSNLQLNENFVIASILNLLMPKSCF